MKLNEYQDYAHATAKYKNSDKVLTFEGINYTVLGLAGESGEVANKWKKVSRDFNGVLTDEQRTKLIDEAGDVAWYLSELLFQLNVTFEVAAKNNINKLASRYNRGVIGGSGDTR
jgi:NTP pyrophosphatase (non-canonical NTP hydrolase)